MAKNTQTWIIVILLIAGALFVAGMYTQKQHPVFSILTSSRNCLDYFINSGLIPQGSTALPALPFTWQYTSTQQRCITIVSPSGNGCQIAYDAGACSSVTPTCTESWSCTAWSTCSANSQTRTCTDTNNCGTTTSKPTLTQSCTSGTTTSCLLTDTNGNGKTDDSEVITAIHNWAIA